MDAGGHDTYHAGIESTNGGGDGGLGLLLDLEGNDAFTAAGGYTNGGGAYIRCVGLLWDVAGDDRYSAGDLATNGGAAGFQVFGLLVDAHGDDAYTAGADGANGGVADVNLGGFESVGAGVLLDGGGRDTYLDAIADCTDCTIVPKGVTTGGYGAQIDR